VATSLALLLLFAQAPPPLESTSLIASAATHIREKRLDAAIRDLTRAAGLQPRSATIHLLLGQAYLAKGTPELVAQAKAEFQEARDLDASQVLASFYIAKIDLDLGRIRQAEQELRRALGKKPGEHYLLALLGEVRRQQGYAEEAIELTTKALAAGPEAFPVHYYRALAWWDRKDDVRALQDLDRLLASPFATADAFVAAGMIHLQKDRLEEAEANFRRAVQIDKDRAEPHFRLAQVLRRQRRLDLALEELGQVESAPQLSSPYFQKLLADAACERGLIRIDEGDAAGAKVWFRRALEIDPSHQEATNRLQP
jgi:tetratricopeptide (TPR) repeat protein